MSATSPTLSLSMAAPRRRERWIESGLLACALTSVFTTVCIVAVLVFEAFGFFRVVAPWRLFTDAEWTPLFAEPQFGVWSLLAGTVLCASIALAVAIPTGVLAAIFSSEYCPPRARAALELGFAVVASVPSVIYGYVALLFITPWLRAVVPSVAPMNALAPGLVMGVMLTPMIASWSGAALLAVPDTLREAAYALGASRVATILRVVLPSARHQITAVLVLAVARALGETIIVAIAAGHNAHLTFDAREPVETLTGYLVQVSMGNVAAGALEYRTLFVVGGFAFVVVFGLNGVSHALRRRSLGLQGGR